MVEGEGLTQRLANLGAPFVDPFHFSHSQLSHVKSLEGVQRRKTSSQYMNLLYYPVQ